MLHIRAPFGSIFAALFFSQCTVAESALKTCHERCFIYQSLPCWERTRITRITLFDQKQTKKTKDNSKGSGEEKNKSHSSTHSRLNTVQRNTCNTTASAYRWPSRAVSDRRQPSTPRVKPAHLTYAAQTSFTHRNSSLSGPEPPVWFSISLQQTPNISFFSNFPVLIT